MRLLARTVRTPLGLAAVILLALVLVTAIFAPILWGAQAAVVDTSNLLAGPSAEHPVGTDALGRDLLLRVLVATRLSVVLALMATVVAVTAGLILGVAPWLMGRAGRSVTWVVSVAVAFPGLLLALFFAVIFGTGWVGATWAIGLAGAPSFARLCQTLVAGVASRDFVAAARIGGVGRVRVLFRHVLPNIGEPLIVNATIGAGGALLAFAGLSFIGLGVQPPEYDWGRLMMEGLSGIYVNPLAALAPGIAIVIAGLAFNLTGEAAARSLGIGSTGIVAKIARVQPKPRPGDVAGDAIGDTLAAETDTDAAAPADTVLDVRDLRVVFPGAAGPIQPVRGVSFSMRRGEVVGIVGESGSGKSLTALAIAQLIEHPGVVDADRLTFCGEDLLAGDPKRHRSLLGTSLALVFQDPMTSFNPTKKMGAQLAEVATEHHGMTRRQAQDRAVDRLAAVQISNPELRAKQYPHEFSGGMRQRAMIGAGLMGKPALIIADEPTTALDVTVQQQVLDLLKAIRDDEDVAILLISHDVSVVAEICDRVLVMYAGRIVEELPADRLREAQHPYTRALMAAVPDMQTDLQRPLATVARPPGRSRARPGRLRVRGPLPARRRALPRGRPGARAGRARTRRLLARGGAARPHAGRAVRRRRGGAAVSELRIENATVRFGSGRSATVAVDDVSLTVPDGEVLGLVGESGSGKSTIARAAVGLVPLDSGRILLDGEPIDVRHGRRPLQMVFQDPFSSLDPRMTIGASIAEILPRGLTAPSATTRSPACSSSCTWTRRAPRPTRARCRAVSVSASRSPGPSPGGPRCSSPTRSPLPSTSRSRDRCSTSCASCRPSSACRCCSSRTTSPSSATSPRASPSCTAAASSRKGPPPRCSSNPQDPYTQQLLAAIPGQPTTIPNPQGANCDPHHAHRGRARPHGPEPAHHLPRRHERRLRARRHRRRRRQGDQLDLADGCRGRSPPPHPGHDRHGAGVLAGRRAPSRSCATASCGPFPSRAASPCSARTSRSARARRCGALPVTASSSRHRSTARPPPARPTPTARSAPRARSRATASTTRPTAAGSSAASACSCTSSTSASGAVRQLTDGDEHVASPSWAPDGDFIAYTVKPEGVDHLTFRMAVHVIDPADAAAPARIVAFADGVAATVAYAPDGRHLVVVGWAGDPEGIARLYRVDLATGEARELAASLDRNVMPGAPAYPGALPQVTANGDVLFAIRDRGCTHLYAVPLDGGEPRHIHGGDAEVVSGLSVAGDKAAIALSTATSFGEIVLLDLAAGTSSVVTAHGAAPEGVELFVRESREFAISDGVTVQGWLLRDPAVTGPTPLLVDVHGGPHNAWNGAVDEMHVFHQELAARGWTVLTINPRGSDGYGEEFFQAVNGNWGLIDAKDFLEPIDALVAEGAVDPKRLALTGYSYGGFMTCYLTGHDDRFAAAVAGGVVADMTSMGGTTDDAHLLNVFEIGAMPWDPADRERLAAMSPYTAVDKVTTPTLVLHGEADVRCPVGQAEQWHYALAERGIPTRLVVYPGASHIFPILGVPSHRVDYATRVVEWVEQYAGDAAGPRPEKIDAAHWQRRLAALAERHKVPGAQLGILRLGGRRGRDRDRCATAP